MESSSSDQSIKRGAGRKQSDMQSNNPKSTGNEHYEKDIFIDLEPSSKTGLLVREPDKIQQVEQNSDPNQGSVHHNLSTSSATSSTTDLDDKSWPVTLTKLNTANGSEVFLIGTAHFSLKSVQDVQQVMRAVKPSSVVLELCRERAFLLTVDEESLLEQNRQLSFEKIRGAIAEKGVVQGLIYTVFVKMSANLTEKLGLAPGSEFRAGSAEAQKIPGCSVVLGDRSLRVTIARAVASISMWQKVKLIFQLLFSNVSVTQEDVEKCKEKDMLEQMLQELAGEFPGFKKVILDERNIYLAHSIYRWAQDSETSNGPQRVVAIVGIGHISGIVEHWGKTTNEDIMLLSQVPVPSKTRRVVYKTIKYCSIALLLYVSCRIIIPSSIQTAIHDKIGR